MKTLIVAVALAFLAQNTPNAQTSAQLQWDTDAPLAEVTAYTKAVRIDGALLTAPITCAAKTGVPTQTTCTVTAPALATGSHSIEISHSAGGYTSVYTFTGVDPSKGPREVTGMISITTRKVIPIP